MVTAIGLIPEAVAGITAVDVSGKLTTTWGEIRATQ